MDPIKAFLSKDWVKAVAAVLAIAIPIVCKVWVTPITTTVLNFWTASILPFLIAYGVISGGTSNLNSTASQARADTLATVAPPKP
jgi:hypothetical protein